MILHIFFVNIFITELVTKLKQWLLIGLTIPFYSFCWDKLKKGKLTPKYVRITYYIGQILEMRFDWFRVQCTLPTHVTTVRINLSSTNEIISPKSFKIFVFTVLTRDKYDVMNVFPSWHGLSDISSAYCAYMLHIGHRTAQWTYI